MKNGNYILLITIYLIILSIPGNAQKEENIIAFTASYKWVPFDYINGPGIGVEIRPFSKNISLSLCSDFLFKMGEIDGSQGMHYGVVQFVSTKYIDINYMLYSRNKISFGYGWVYNGEGLNRTFNKYNGYSVASIVYGFYFERLFLNVRCEVPLNKEYSPFGNLTSVFPVSFSISRYF